MLVVLFGLYHGLIFLPVALALIGPEPHQVKLDFVLNSKKSMTLPAGL